MNYIKVKIEPRKWVIGLCVAGLLVASSAQAVVTLTFDENGNTTTTPAGPPVITHVQTADNLGADANGIIEPSGNGATTLDYLFPITLSTRPQYGWVAIYDPGPNGALSDLIHFDNSDTINGVTYISMFFYSVDHDGDLADNWVSGKLPTGSGPTSPNGIDAGTNVLTAILASANLVKITEDANGDAFYTPSTATSPGYDVNFSGTGVSPLYSYEFISGVPEPTTIIAGGLLLLPFGASTMQSLRNKRRG